MTQVRFDFDHVEAKKIKDVVCPLCGGEIVKIPFGYGCANYSSADEDSCRFSIGKMAGKNLTETQVRELLKDGRTSTIRGFSRRPATVLTPALLSQKRKTERSRGLNLTFRMWSQKK